MLFQIKSHFFYFPNLAKCILNQFFWVDQRVECWMTDDGQIGDTVDAVITHLAPLTSMPQCFRYTLFRALALITIQSQPLLLRIAFVSMSFKLQTLASD